MTAPASSSTGIAADIGAASWADAHAAPEAFARGLLHAMVIGAPSGAAMLCAPGGARGARDPLLTAGQVDDLLRVWNELEDAPAASSIAPLAQAETWIASTPCRVAEDETILAVALIAGQHAQAKQALMRMELIAGLSEAWRVGRAQQAQTDAAEAPARALAVLSSVNEHPAFFAACLATCNEISRLWDAERVSIGFVRSGGMKVESISHAERIVRESRLARSLEAVMDEAVDQDREIASPPDPEDVVICRAAREHLRDQGAGSCVTLPLRERGECVGAICVEWAERSSPTPRAVESLRLTAELLTPRLLDIRAKDRWLGARAWAACMDAGASVVGPRHTGTKLAALVAAVFLFLIFFLHGENRVTADMSLESISQRVLPAPFDAFLAQTHTSIGARVEPGDLLATLDTAELRLELAELRARERSSLTEEAIARRNGETAEAQAAHAEAESAAARIALIESRIAAAEIRAPVAGVVTEGDHEQRLGAPVAMGDRLFVISPVGSLRAELLIPEGRIAEVSEGSTGELATASFPDRRVGFTVERIDPVARVIEGGNVFAARVRLDDAPAWMRPGMEGVAKISAGTRSYVSIWTRDAVNWVRMKLWI